MFLTLSSTCVQKFSYWHPPFFFLSHSVAVAVLSEISHVACRALDDSFSFIRIFPFFQEFVQMKSQQIEMHASARTQLSVFFVERVYLSGYSHKTSQEFEHFGLQNAKNIWRENLLAQRTFGAKLHKSNFESKDGTRSMKY